MSPERSRQTENPTVPTRRSRTAEALWRAPEVTTFSAQLAFLADTFEVRHRERHGYLPYGTLPTALNAHIGSITKERHVGASRGIFWSLHIVDNRSVVAASYARRDGPRVEIYTHNPRPAKTGSELAGIDAITGEPLSVRIVGANMRLGDDLLPAVTKAAHMRGTTVTTQRFTP